MINMNLLNSHLKKQVVSISKEHSEFLNNIRMGNIKEANTFIKEGGDFHCQDTLGNSPVMLAVIHNRKDILKHLLQAGASIERPNLFGQTSFMMAARNRDIQMSDLLINDANYNSANIEKALCECAWTNDLDYLNYLLEKVPDIQDEINYQRPKGFTPLILATRKGHLSIVEILLKHGADPNIQDFWEGKKAMDYAWKKQNIDIVKALLSHGSRWSDDMSLDKLIELGIQTYPSYIEDAIREGRDVKIYTDMHGKRMTHSKMTKDQTEYVLLNVNPPVDLDALIQEEVTSYERDMEDLLAEFQQLIKELENE